MAEDEYKTIKDANELVQKLFGAPMRKQSIPRHLVIVTTPDNVEFKATANTKFEADLLVSQQIIDHYNSVCPNGHVIGTDFNTKVNCDNCTVIKICAKRN